MQFIHDKRDDEHPSNFYIGVHPGKDLISTYARTSKPPLRL